MNFRFLLRAWTFRTRRDRAEIAWILANLQRGAICLDVGAHKGGWTYWLHKAVGPGGRVIAFEPQPDLSRCLAESLRPRAFRNVTLEEVALSAHVGSAELLVPGGPGSTSPSASLNQVVRELEAETQVIEVPTTTLDAYADEHGLGRVAFVKVDVEGHELEVLDGAAETLARDRPTLLVESEARHTGEDGVNALFARLSGLGYEGGFFAHDGLHPLAEFDFALHQPCTGPRYWDGPGYCNNFLFTARG